LIGDFCLDRYLEIDPALGETSIETGLEVHNVTRIRSQPGGAGTILNNLVALGVGRIFAVGFCGNDGEGYELKRALQQQPGVDLRHFVQSNERHTFTYTKPLICEAGKTPAELNRLDIKNWTPTPAELENAFITSLKTLAAEVDTSDRPRPGG
jgi:bifunctional ADP-heptose synthase (sugar kinase/adenylyltransferase)